MRAYTFTALVVITVTIAFCLYVWHDTRKFEESLSPLQERKTVKTTSQTPFVDGAPQQVVTKTDSAKPNELEHAHPHPVPDRHEEIVETPSEEASALVNDAALAEAPATPSPAVSKKKKKKIPWDKATVDQRIANMRSWLVKNHDNTAEIDEFLKLQRIFMESPSMLVNMSPDDSLRHAELAARLYPGTGNEAAYQSMLEVRERLKNGTLHIDLDNAEIVPIPVNQ